MGKTNLASAWRFLIGRSRKFSESPAPADAEIDESDLVRLFAGNALPAVVKHCQFGSPAIACAAMFKFRPGDHDVLRAPIIGLRTTHLFALGLVILLCGCAGSWNVEPGRSFTFGQDTFSYPNDLVWVYYHDPETGRFRHKTREVPPDYTHHCFVVARSARQFFQHARFDPTLPVADEATYRRLIRRVVKTSPRRQLEENERIVIPGYTNLFQFSQGQETLLKAGCGGAWQSYFQRGHWRMIFPFSERHQEKMVAQLREQLRLNRPPVVHIVRFPSLTINHALVIIGVAETIEAIQFTVYDPYDPAKPGLLTYNRVERQFYFPANDYFVGGKVDIYEIYCSWNY